MSHRTIIVGNRPIFSESAVLDAIGSELLAIKTQDRLTWDDVAAVLGVSDVQAAKYVDGSAKMSIVTFARGKREWNGRFTGAFDRLCRESRPVSTDEDRSRQSKVLRAALAMAESMQDGGEITAAEVRANRTDFEAAHAALGEMLDKLGGDHSLRAVRS